MFFLSKSSSFGSFCLPDSFRSSPFFICLVLKCLKIIMLIHLNTVFLINITHFVGAKHMEGYDIEKDRNLYFVQ